MAYLNLTSNATSARLKTQSLQIETYERSTSEEAEKSFCAPETIPGASSLTLFPSNVPCYHWDGTTAKKNTAFHINE